MKIGSQFDGVRAGVLAILVSWVIFPMVAPAWQPVTSGLPAGITVTRLAGDGGNVLALYVSNPTGNRGVYFSTNAGLDWFKGEAALPGVSATSMALLVKGNSVYLARNSQTIGTNALLYSSDFGATWRGGFGIPNGTFLDLLATDGLALFTALQNGTDVYRSTDGGANWELAGTRNVNFSSGTVRTLGGSGGRAVATTASGHFLLSDATTNWLKTSTLGNHVAGTRLAWQGGNLLSLYGDANRRILGLPDGTTNWFDATNGLVEGSFNLGAYVDLAASTSAVFAANWTYNPSFQAVPGFYQSTNGGSNWTALPATIFGNVAPKQLAVSVNALFALVGNSLYRVGLINGVPVFPPAITLSPAGRALHLGANLALTASATGEAPLTLQWLKDGVPLTGQTNATLSISNVQTNDAGSYTFTASNLGGTTASSSALVQVFPRLPGWPNLDFQPGWFARDFSGILVQGTVYTVAALTNGQILVGGQFTRANAQPATGGTFTGGVTAHGIARLNPDGSADTGFQTTTGITNGNIQAIAVAPDGKIVVGGQFTSYAGATRTNIARLFPDGSVDPSFATNIINSDITAILLQSDGRIVMRGYFSAINGVARNGLARLNADGSFDPTWPAGAGPNSGPYDFALLPGDRVLAAGCFSQFNGTAARRRLALVDTNGVASTNLSVEFNTCPNYVSAQPGGLFWVAGPFTQYSNAPVPSLVRFATDGALVSVAPTNLNSPGRLFSQQDGSLITSFLAPNSRRPLVRFNADGTTDSSFNAGGGFNADPLAFAMTPSGDLYAAGSFSEFYGMAVGGLVKVYAAPTNVLPAFPVLALQPRSIAGVVGGTVQLRAASLGAAPLSFLWLKGGASVPGETNTTLVLPNLSASITGDYQFVASNPSGSVTSSVATVSLASAPSITANPPALTGSISGGNVLLSVAATGTDPLFFRWYRNGVAISGATNSSHTISNLSASFTGNWQAIVSNAFGSATSTVCSVQIGTPPNIIGKANNQTLNGEGNITLFVTATGSEPFTYFWYRNGELAAVRTNNAWTLTNATPPQAGSYVGVVSNFAASTTSAVISVTIRNPFLSQSPPTRFVREGGVTNFTAAATGTAPLDFLWYRRGYGSQFGITNFLGTGTNLTVGPVTRLDGFYQYYVVVSNQWGTMTSGLASLDVHFPPAITGVTASNVTAEVNSYASFGVNYEGQPTPTFRWFKDGVLQASLLGSTVTFTSAQTNNSGMYVAVISNYLGSVTSAPIAFHVKPPRGPTITTDLPATRLVRAGGSLSLDVAADGSPQLWYRWYREGTPVTAWQNYGSFYQASMPTNQAGGFQVVVTNVYGAATSSVAQVSVVQPQPADYANKRFVKIADTLTPIPGLGPLRFGGFRDAFLRNGQVWFGGSIPAVPFSVGVYHWNNGALSRLVDTNTVVPGSSSKFTNFYGSTFLSDGKVIFGGFGAGDQHGLYAVTNGSVIKLYDRTTVMPGRADTFGRFGWPAVAGNQFAFLGFHNIPGTSFVDYRAVYVSSNGVLTKLADTNTALPNLGGHFVGSSSQVGFDGETVAWWALNEATNGGIFRISRTTPIASAADEATVNPATGQMFDGFISPPNVTTGRVYLVGHDGSFNSTLFYRDAGGPLTVIAKPGDVVPGRGLIFDSAAYPFQTSSRAGAFFDGADGAGYYGIFHWNGTNTAKVIDSFDSLDGQSVVYVFVADAEDDCVLFYVTFANGQQALYATLPEGQDFSQWAAANNLPPGKDKPADDANGNGVPNIFEFYFGNHPLNPGPANLPVGITVNISGSFYPALTFLRSRNIGGVTLLPEVSSTLDFANSLGYVVEAVVDLGNGTERVTIRSAQPQTAAGAQFLRIRLKIP